MILLIDKPKGWTSFDVVAKVRSILKEKKVGHGGTLDPNATGLLIVGTSSDTKKLGEITKNTFKIYEATVILGKISTTADSDGEIQISNEEIISTKKEIEAVLKTFIGEIEQIPPAYSAIRVNGKKAYELARKGVEVKMEARKITIYSISDVEYEYPTFKFTCKVSSGTYIRTLAEDVGKKLKTGAYLSELRRIQVGEYMVQKAISLQQLQHMHSEGQLQH